MPIAALLFAVNAVVAYPITPALFERRDVAECVGALLAGTGPTSSERAAFLILRDDGTFICRRWAPTAARRVETWDGAIPNGTVAVLHTHPFREPLPSEHDAGEARRIGAPIIVLTPEAVTMATDRGEIVVIQNSRAADVVDRVRHDETGTDHSTDARQAGAVPHQRTGTDP